jgi:hypothetical protein
LDDSLTERALDELARRFELRRRLGTGGFCAVHEAYDRQSGRVVALKELNRTDTTALLRFKQEFRFVADLAHPNLVTLYELLALDGRWYVSMELVDGPSFLEYVRPTAGDTSLAATLEISGDGTPAAPAPAVDAPDGAEPTAGVDEARLRGALEQLAGAVDALHRRGLLHCDLKPSNVLVASGGRVVVLDFGLAQNVARPPQAREGAQPAGTPEYMAPEQAAGEPLSPATDWYAVGVMLFEALTGALPIGGGRLQMVVRKQLVDAPDPRALVPEVPADLAELCIALLARSPEARPRGAEVLERLCARRAPEANAEVFVGRVDEQGTLVRALAKSRRGRAAVVHVRAPSGVGKTALVRRFVDRLAEPVRVLEARCYEGEAIPYKALDGIIDMLAGLLGSLPADERAELEPPDFELLGQLFPVLQRRSPAPASATAGLEPRELRRRAVGALRALLAKLAARSSLVLWIDDLQWGDRDSLALLQALLSSSAPPILLIVSYRPGESDHGDALLNLREIASHTIDLAPLSPGDALELATRLTGAATDAQAVALESGGDPFFLRELLREAHRPGTSAIELLRARIVALPAEARRLLEVVAVAARPVDALVAQRASDQPVDDDRTVALLRSLHLLRMRRLRSVEALEPAHDRVRAAAMAEIGGDAQAARHLALAHALEQSGRAGPEELATHFLAGGELQQARRCTEEAARRAAELLAFDRAAALYAQAIELAPASERRALEVRRGDALAAAGRGIEAARAFRLACDGASDEEQRYLTGRAGEQLLRAGHFTDGLRTLEPLLAAERMRLPRTRYGAVAAFLRERARLWLRGAWSVEPEGKATPAELQRIDLCWSIAHTVGAADPLRAAAFHTRHTVLAFAAGERSRVARALASETIMAAVSGRGDAHVARLLARADELARASDHPHAQGWVAAARGTIAFAGGRWRESATQSAHAIELLRRAGHDIEWEVGSVAAWWHLPALYHLGDLLEIARLAPACLREAEELGNRYIAITLRTNIIPVLWCADDQPDEAERQSTEALRSFKLEGAHLQAWSDLFLRGHVLLYRGEGAQVVELLAARWGEMKRSFALRIPMVRLQTWALRGTAALAAAWPSRERAPLIRLAERDAASLEREPSRWAHAYAKMLRAGLAALRGGDDAIVLCERAETELRELEMALTRAAMQHLRGRLIGGAEGAALITDAEAWMRTQRIRRPERFAHAICPGGER